VISLLLVPTAWELGQLPSARGEGVEVAVCGVGLLAAGLLTARRLSQGDVQRCLLVGIAGTRDPGRAPIGTLVEGTSVRNEAIGAGAGADFLALGAMGLPGEDLPPDEMPLAPAHAPGAQPGVIGTVAAASGSPQQAAAWQRRDPDVLVEEMEGYGVALACARARVPLGVLRAVSNVAGCRDRAEWESKAALAVLDAGLAGWLAEGAIR
jgi:futalosine hydrolase